ncbi:MAG: ABC transporter substrate-binding protein [Acidimicrobiaceae bacterium]|nr:ABC transporter substrate-binding protein [Acidimicrobiaceae bacterium]
MKARNMLMRLLVPLLALGLIAAACGDDEEPVADTSAADAAAAQAEADAAAAQAEADAAADRAAAAEAAAAEAQAALEDAMAEAEGAVDPEVVAALEAELEAAAAAAESAAAEADAAAAAQAAAEAAAAAAEAEAEAAMAEPEPEPETMTDVTLQLQWFTQSQFAGYYAAVATGIYEDYGLNVEILEGGVEIVPASVLDSGAADFAVSWVPRGLVPREEGANITNIAQVFQRSATLQVSFADSGISTVADLEGRTVGNWGFGNEFELLAGLRKSGLDPAGDVQLVQQNFDMLALISGEIDAAQAMIYNEYAQVLETVNPDTGELFQPDDLNIINWNDVGTAMLQDALWADADRLDDDPAYHETAVKFVEASLKGWIYCRDNPEECVDIVLDNAPTLGRSHQTWQLNEINALIWPSPQGVGVMDTDLWAQTVDVAVNEGILASAPVEDAYRPEIAWEAVTNLRNAGVDVIGNNWQRVPVTLLEGGE